MSPDETVECAVIGAGVIGLAVARRLARAGREVVVLEAADAIGTVTSSRNSEVIHAGIYYPAGSLKARLCVEGRRRLYDFCATHGVAHKRLGKLIVATSPAQISELEALKAKAAANGVSDLEWRDAEAVHALEPELACVAALLSPSTGIVDSHGLMLALQGDGEAVGAGLALDTPVLGGAIEDGGILLHVGGAQPMRLRCRIVVNAAGLGAQAIARALQGLDPATVPGLYYAKGNYFTLSGRTPFRHLIYPVPEPGGLGVHVTLDLQGRARFGPDVEWVTKLCYAVDPRRAERFYDAVRRYWPALPDGALLPGYAGIRPKLSPAGHPSDDFVIQGPAAHGVPGLVNLYGIESPGLTSCLAVADEVAALLD
ncbi:MAG: NAD(P)/FAD-dependent oxidoreductase [Pseudomonadota bacterium]